LLDGIFKGSNTNPVLIDTQGRRCKSCQNVWLAKAGSSSIHCGRCLRPFSRILELVTVSACKCEACGNIWFPEKGSLPIKCGKCKSWSWNRSQKEAEALKRAETYHEPVRRFLADPEKMGALYGTLLGDATLTYIPPGRYQNKEGHDKCGKDGTCYVRIKHAVDQKALVELKHGFIREIAGEISIAKPQNPKWQDNHFFYTRTSPLWQALYRELYTGAREVVGKTGHVQRFKRINRAILDKVTDRGLAWWVMDDGCYSFNSDGYGFFRLSTQGYTFEENELIVGWLKDRYGVKASLNECAKQGVRLATYDSFVIYIGPEEFKLLRPAIEPFVIPELRNKLGYEREVRCPSGMDCQSSTCDLSHEAA
jgi:hypothetical protein